MLPGALRPAGCSSDSTPQKLAYQGSSTTSARWARVAGSTKPAKPIAQIMTKTIKDFKTRFFRPMINPGLALEWEGGR